MDKAWILILCIVTLRFGIASVTGVIEQSSFWGIWWAASSVILGIMTIKDKDIKWWKWWGKNG